MPETVFMGLVSLEQALDSAQNDQTDDRRLQTIPVDRFDP